MTDFIVNPDSFLQLRENNWVLSNPRTKTHVKFSAPAGFLNYSARYSEQEWISALENITACDWTEEFFGASGLHVDHTGILQKETNLSGLELFNLLIRRWLLVKEDLEDYRLYLKVLISPLDRNHLGSFHQRVGQYLTIEKRIGAERWRWWHDQKFTKDGKKVNSGPYQDIQEEYFDKYFNSEKLNGKKVLDFGCGNGFYSNKLANLGAEVTAIDTSEDLINIAKNNCSKDINFIHIDPNQKLEDVLNSNYDLIFMQDVLLILMKPENGKELENLDSLLSSLRRLLVKGGKLYTMEPNAVFWLAGRYGDSNNPYAVVTEYQNQVFNVVPTLPEVISKMSNSGFALIEYQHPKSNIGDQYVNNFCIWDFMCFIAI